MTDPRHLSPAQFALLYPDKPNVLPDLHRYPTDSAPKGHTYVDGEAVNIEELHKSAGFVERDPAYLLEKHKAKKAK